MRRAAVDRYAASHGDLVSVAPEPHSGPRRAKRAKELLSNQARALPEYRGQSLWLVVSTVVLAAALASAQGPAGRGGGGGGRGRIPIQPGEECPSGTTLVRVGLCQAPQAPPPSIVDYRRNERRALDNN